MMITISPMEMIQILLLLLLNPSLTESIRCYKCDLTKSKNDCFDSGSYCSNNQVCSQNETIISVKGSDGTSLPKTPTYSFNCKSAETCRDNRDLTQYCCCTDNCYFPDGTGSGGMQTCLFNHDKSIQKQYVGERCSDGVKRATYRLYTLETKSQMIAKRNCQAVNGQLGAVTMKNDVDRILALNVEGKCRHAWIGLLRGVGTTWRWPYILATAVYTRWKMYEPSIPTQKDKYGNPYSYAVMDMYTGEWVSTSVITKTDKTCFVCEFREPTDCDPNKSVELVRKIVSASSQNGAISHGVHAFTILLTLILWLRNIHVLLPT